MVEVLAIPCIASRGGARSLFGEGKAGDQVAGQPREIDADGRLGVGEVGHGAAVRLDPVAQSRAECEIGAAMSRAPRISTGSSSTSWNTKVAGKSASSTGNSGADR